MTVEEMLWNNEFECRQEDTQDGYDYNEEFNMEAYYEGKSLFEQFGEYFNPAS